ncbi:DnaJ-like protein subfamily C GRV2 [Diplonema papillatum]|nr:DnaJ-like protein subfamily C GRV2 [Diplonema papillatum]
MMKENAQGAALMFDSSSENPELIWNSDMRDRCIRKCTELREDIVAALSKDPNVVWRLPDSINAEKPIDEYEVGGVYLKLYVKQPAWDLRSPRKFLTALFEECLVKLEEDPAAEEEVELVSKSIVCLLNTRTVLADQVPQLGHLPKLFSAISKAKPVTSHAALQVVHQLASSKAVVESMGGMNSVQPLLDFMRASGVPDDQLGQVIETIERMMTKNNPERGCLVKKALDCDLPQELFNVLDKTSSSAVRAVAVKALKAMAGGSSPNCQVVREVLAENPKWETYQAQKHDLFLEKSTFSGYLTGPSSGGAMLSLTSGPAASSAAHSAAPPPISDNIKAAAAPLPTQRDAQPDTALSSLPPSNTAPPAPTPPAPTTPAPTTPAPTTPAPTTPAPTPPAPTTPAPTTPAPASPAPSPSAPSTPAPSTPVPSSSPIAPAPSVPAQQSASQPSTPDDCGRDIEEKEPQQKSEAAQPQPEPSDAEEEEAQQQPEVETSPSKEPATTKTRPTPTDGPPSATLDDSEDGKGNQDEGEGVHNKELSATRNNSSSTNSSDQPAEKPAGEVKATPGTDEEEEAGKQDAPPANGT